MLTHTTNPDRTVYRESHFRPDRHKSGSQPIRTIPSAAQCAALIAPYVLFGMYGYQLYNGGWRFRFDFYSPCIAGASPSEWLDRLPGKGSLGKLAKYLGKAQRYVSLKPAGDVDGTKCACRQFDKELKKLFLANGWGTGNALGGASYSESQARAMLGDMRRKVEKLNKNTKQDCDKCNLPWNSLTGLSISRRTPFIGNGISR